MLFLLIVFLLIGAKLLLPSLHAINYVNRKGGNKTSLLDHYYASWKGVCWGFMEEKMSHRYDEMIIPNNFQGNDRRLKYIGKKNRERFLILTSFLRRVSNVLSIPSDPLIPCGSFDPQAPASFLSTHQA
ncbi:hypothetical protein Bca4012_100373 [Brassica carinata]